MYVVTTTAYLPRNNIIFFMHFFLTMMLFWTALTTMPCYIILHGESGNYGKIKEVGLLNNYKILNNFKYNEISMNGEI